MEYRATESYTIRNAELLFKNFSGEKGKFNPSGKRTFSVVIDDPVLAANLERDGYRTRLLLPRDPEDEPKRILTINVNYSNEKRQPDIYIITQTKETLLSEDTVKNLDFAEIKKVDLTFAPYNWEVNGETGVSAYLRHMYVWIHEDPLASEYNAMFEERRNRG